jgi:hypothetical protein
MFVVHIAYDPYFLLIGIGRFWLLPLSKVVSHNQETVSRPSYHQLPQTRSGIYDEKLLQAASTEAVFCGGVEPPTVRYGSKPNLENMVWLEIQPQKTAIPSP